MRVADYIFKRVADLGIEHVFLVTGGGAMFLNDAIGLEPRLKYVCNLHEQACAIAAEGYARVTGKAGVVCVTTGPGGTNAITGVAGAWLDSIPMVVISGQIKRETCTAFYPELKLRQLGDQELNIVDVVRPIIKYATMIKNPEDIGYELDKALYLANNGRPGPVWLDIPLDIQSATLDISKLKSFNFEEIKNETSSNSIAISQAIEHLKNAKRPAIIAGIGVRHAKAIDKMLEFAENNQIPILTSISGIDLIETDNPLFFGRPGILGERAANFIMQNCDCLLVLGTRMGIRITGYAYDKVAREACKIMVDIDEAELNKPTFKPDVKIHADVGLFLDNVLKALPKKEDNNNQWLLYCNKLKDKYPVITEVHRNRVDYVSSYVFPELISKYCKNNAIIVTGNGVAYTSTFQALPVKKGMRVFANEACASMGYGLPAAIGAVFAGKNREVICITGDGSLQMNIQELQTLKNYNLPIKLFVYNNEGYLSIKLTQRSFFNSHFVGSEDSSGVILPELEKIAQAYCLPYYKITNNDEAKEMLPSILQQDGPIVVEVLTDPFEELGPKAASKKLPDGRMVSAPLEDLTPFLPREEFLDNMIIKPDLSF